MHIYACVQNNTYTVLLCAHTLILIGGRTPVPLKHNGKRRQTSATLRIMVRSHIVYSICSGNDHNQPEKKNEFNVFQFNRIVTIIICRIAYPIYNISV